VRPLAFFTAVLMPFQMAVVAVFTAFHAALTTVLAG
jgi:hypothetical protein